MGKVNHVKEIRAAFQAKGYETATDARIFSPEEIWFRHKSSTGSLVKVVNLDCKPYSKAYSVHVGVFNVLTLDPAIEQVMLQSLRNVEAGGNMPIEPKYAERLQAKLSAESDRMMKANMLPVLLCSPDLRRHVRALSERMIPHMRILSMTEVPNTVSLKAYDTVSI